MNNNIENFINKIRNENISIYGAGYDGTLLYHILEINSINVNCFFVDDGYRINKRFKDIPILEYSELIEKSKEVLILVAMNANPNKNERINLLKQNGFCNIIDCNRDLINSLLLFNCRNYIKQYKLDISNKYIEFNNYKNQKIKIINPLMLSFEYQIAFALEMPDLLLPEIDNKFEFMNEGKYEIDNVKIEIGDVVIDCGANIGIFSAIAAAKQANVYAFEPVPNIVVILNKLKNIYKKIEIHPLALSDKNGYIKFSISEINSTSHSMLPNYEKTIYKNHHLNGISKTIDVQMITIDNFVKNYNINRVDFIKADIEGAERLMLQGATEVLKKYAPKLSICTYHFNDDKEVLEDIILKANPNYIIKHKWKKLYAYVPK